MTTDEVAERAMADVTKETQGVVVTLSQIYAEVKGVTAALEAQSAKLDLVHQQHRTETGRLSDQQIDQESRIRKLEVRLLGVTAAGVLGGVLAYVELVA